jgi:hypothetical protein
VNHAHTNVPLALMELLVTLVLEIELILQTVTVQPDGTITEPMMLLVTNVKKSV